MDEDQLNARIKEFEAILAEKRKKRTPLNYTAPIGVKKAAKDSDHQRLKHRNVLLILVTALSGFSFAFLVYIINFQMNERLVNPDYMGVSDTVINIVAVSVFAQVIAVVAIIARLVFKD